RPTASLPACTSGRARKAFRAATLPRRTLRTTGWRKADRLLDATAGVGKRSGVYNGVGYDGTQKASLPEGEECVLPSRQARPSEECVRVVCHNPAKRSQSKKDRGCGVGEGRLYTR